MVYALADEAIRLGDEHGVIIFREVIGYQRGWALVGLGRMEEGLTEMLRCRTALPIEPPIRGYFGGPPKLLGGRRRSEGLQAVREGLDLLRRGGNRWFDAELLRLKGELLLLGSNGTEAEASQCFRDAIEMARHQNAKSWELRATMSLARLLAKQRYRDDARTMLTEICNCFTEGFETADLKDAKALLDDLAD